MLRHQILSGLMLLATLTACNNSSNNKEVTEQEKPTEAAPVHNELKASNNNIVFFGTSLTAGFGLEQGEAYPELIQKKIDSLNLPYKTVNAGLSGETSSAGTNRIDWVLKQPISIFVLELGANDGLRGISVPETTKNLQIIIDRVREKYPQAKLLLAGMQVPPNMGQKYANEFKEMFKTIADKNGMTLIPFLLEGVAGKPKLNQGDGIHPTVQGQIILADNVWQHLFPLLQ